MPLPSINPLGHAKDSDPIPNSQNPVSTHVDTPLDLSSKQEFPPLPPSGPFFFPSTTTTTTPNSTQSDDSGHSNLRFANRHELNQMYTQLKALKGWTDADEEGNRCLGTVTSKRKFVETQLPALRRMGWKRIPTKEEQRAAMMETYVNARSRVCNNHCALWEKFGVLDDIYGAVPDDG